MPYIGKEPANSFISFEKQVFTIVNSQTAYTLDNAVTNENDIRLVINNIVQEPGSGKAYTASGTTLTLSAALVNGTDEMYCVFLGKAVQTVNTPDGSVNTAAIADNAVTSAKLTYPLTTFSSTGIDDNATSNAMTIESSERVQFTRPRSNTLGDAALEIKPSDTVVGVGFRMENTNNDIVVEKSSPSGSEAEIFRIRSGGGIAIGGTGDANTLSDYEEGTWTPQLKISGATTGIVYGTQAGHYTKIGNRVIASAEILLSNKGSNTGNVSMIGLPFTTSNDNYQNASTYNDRVSSPNGDVQVFLLTNATTASIYQSRTDGTNNGNLTGNEMNNDSYLVMFMTYKTG
jgi:hypothetical protein